jgi:hypothetical protein
MDETNCIYVSSRGLLKSCDITYNTPVSSTRELPPNINDIFENCSLYVCNSAIGNLAKNIDKIKHPFVLVSGDADEENYKQMFSNHDEFIEFISNEKIIHWFSQNSTVSHPKVTNLPIGMDYHTIKDESPKEQENTLIEIKTKSASTNFTERIHKCYINFKYPPDSYTYKFDRIEALDKIPSEFIFK